MRFLLSDTMFAFPYFILWKGRRVHKASAGRALVVQYLLTIDLLSCLHYYSVSNKSMPAIIILQSPLTISSTSPHNQNHHAKPHLQTLQQNVSHFQFFHSLFISPLPLPPRRASRSRMVPRRRLPPRPAHHPLPARLPAYVPIPRSLRLRPAVERKSRLYPRSPTSYLGSTQPPSRLQGRVRDYHQIYFAGPNQRDSRLEPALPGGNAPPLKQRGKDVRSAMEQKDGTDSVGEGTAELGRYE